jgi:hypothetical protein
LRAFLLDWSPLCAWKEAGQQVQLVFLALGGEVPLSRSQKGLRMDSQFLLEPVDHVSRTIGKKEGLDKH